ncbi:TonB-dependent receptor [Burkholderia glumae]|uniref:TonB-dependent receptor plug domain-containing protein n=1 Tax=Burkholderia glumae TaxID=337 RepID=UPI000F5E2321|nr:TonB-dependent receptor [Burkholderia glumae]MCQ0029262.1 TonB-dependent receptor [Burkholderia glumae]MCQ0039177.1 TonB-dependent receptor [Burkholderia glumae]QJW79674.1 TonB-dependent receptor [Burkholderia glumae]RQZ75568.1 TonB-dependent receptor [Burkholderia glumae]UVS85360.1 TonB-dependent receptor [Burkholderia glumae]
MRTALVRATLAALCGLPGFARAQSAASAPPPSVSTSAPAAGASRAPAATAAAGAVEPAVLDSVVVTASRSPQTLADALPQTTLFTREDIDHGSATDLPGLLALAPGAQIVRNGGPGSTATLFLRGARSTQSLVLIDGVRVDSASLGAAQLSQLPLAQIDHVEVVNGNVSSLYGSGAIGGVVQVFTRDGGNHPPRFWFSAGYGSYHTQSQDAGVSGRLDGDGRSTFSLALSREKTDGFSALNPAQQPRANPNANGNLGESVSAALKHRFANGWSAGLTYFQSNGANSYDNAFGLPTDLNTLYSRVQQLSVFADGRLADGWTTHLRVSTGNDRSQSWLNGAYTDHFDTDNRQYTWQNDFRLARGQTVQAGYERLDQALDSNEYAAPRRHVNSGWLGYTGRFGNSRFQANVRRDGYSDFGGANSYYLGYGLDLGEHWKVTASVSDAFRAPTFNDLYFPGASNPAIQPERSHSVEAALQYASDALGVMRLSLFQTRYTNLIQYVPDATGFVYTAQNVGRAKVQGIEGAWQGQLGKTDLRVAATLQNPVDESANQDLVRRARHFASFSANRAFGGWRVGGEWLVSGARDDSGEPLGGYGIVNLTARYDITKSWYVSAHLDNLLDKDYQLAYGYNTPRRGAYVTIGWRQP